MHNIEGLDDVNIASIRSLKSPAQLKENIPNLNPAVIAITRHEITNILSGQNPNRLVMIVGPCSIHDVKAATDYSERLLSLRGSLEDELLIVMRTYFEKPRTTVGWKGLAYDPHLDGSSDASLGLTVSRQVLADINSTGMPCAVEFLDPITPQYFADLVSWAAIGARTTESQVHRQLASGLSMPVGFKNSTEGNIQIAVDAIKTATQGHTFFSISEEGLPSEVTTTGNPNTHLVLRGGSNSTNYDHASIDRATRLIKASGLLTEAKRPIMIDCSHGNSAKDHRRQPLVLMSVLEQIQAGQRRIMGFMIESNLYEGRQDYVADHPLRYGVSITDACISWEETERLLVDCARSVRPRTYASA